MLGHTVESFIVRYPSLGKVIRKALPLRPGGYRLPSIESLTQFNQDRSNSLALPVLYALTAIPVDLRVGAVGITTTRVQLADELGVPSDSTIYVGTVIQKAAEKWFRQHHNLSPAETVSKEQAMHYARIINPPTDFDVLIDDACTSRVVAALHTNLHRPVILDTKLLWYLLLKGKDCPIATAQYLPNDLVELAIGFTCETNTANARHLRRRDKKPPEYQPTNKELHDADEERAQRYQGDQQAFRAQYGVSYTPEVIFEELNLVVDTTYLTPEQQVKKITTYLIKRYGSNLTALRTLGLIPQE